MPGWPQVLFVGRLYSGAELITERMLSRIGFGISGVGGFQGLRKQACILTNIRTLRRPPVNTSQLKEGRRTGVIGKIIL